MSRIKAKDTKPDMLVRKFLHAQGFRYRLHDKRLPGKPDIVLAKYHTIIFVHACLPIGRVVFGLATANANIIWCPKQTAPGGSIK